MRASSMPFSGIIETALGYINEIVMWTTTLPSVEMREALMKKVLALHVAVSRLEERGLSSRRRAALSTPVLHSV